MEVIEIDTYITKATVAQATEKGLEFIEAIDTAKMINMMIFKQTDNKTGKQISVIIGEIRRFCNGLECELLQQKKNELVQKESNDRRTKAS